jgi:hypothetical protein
LVKFALEVYGVIEVLMMLAELGSMLGLAGIGVFQKLLFE